MRAGRREKRATDKNALPRTLAWRFSFLRDRRHFEAILNEPDTILPLADEDWVQEHG
jgi:hypothetical protein